MIMFFRQLILCLSCLSTTYGLCKRSIKQNYWKKLLSDCNAAPGKMFDYRALNRIRKEIIQSKCIETTPTWTDDEFDFLSNFLKKQYQPYFQTPSPVTRFLDYLRSKNNKFQFNAMDLSFLRDISSKRNQECVFDAVKKVVPLFDSKNQKQMNCYLGKYSMNFLR